MAEAQLPKEWQSKVGLIYAPALGVDDKVRGDWNDANRKAAVSYDGSFWELQVDHTFVTRDRFTLNGGFSYSVLSGAGADHDVYRFLKHDLTVKNFYLRADWQF